MEKKAETTVRFQGLGMETNMETVISCELF